MSNVISIKKVSRWVARGTLVAAFTMLAVAGAKKLASTSSRIASYNVPSYEKRENRNLGDIEQGKTATSSLLKEIQESKNLSMQNGKTYGEFYTAGNNQLMVEREVLDKMNEYQRKALAELYDSICYDRQTNTTVKVEKNEVGAYCISCNTERYDTKDSADRQLTLGNKVVNLSLTQAIARAGDTFFAERTTVKRD